MPNLMIKCPGTGKLVGTGIAIDKASFDNPTNQMSGNSIRCPACGQTHTWDKKDVAPETWRQH